MTPDELAVLRRYLAPWQIVRVIAARLPGSIATVRAAFLAGCQGGGAGDVQLAWQTRPDGIAWGATFAEAFHRPHVICWRDAFATVHATADAHPGIAARLAQACAWHADHNWRHMPCPHQPRPDLQAGEPDLRPIYDRHYGDAWWDTAVRLSLAVDAARDAFWAATQADQAEPRDLLDLLGAMP